MEKFDPDSLQITKQDLFRVIDALIARWKKNYRANATVITGAHAFKLGIKMIADDKFAELWGQMLHFSNELVTYNEMKRMRGEFPATADFVDLFISRFEGETFDD